MSDDLVIIDEFQAKLTEFDTFLDELLADPDSIETQFGTMSVIESRFSVMSDIRDQMQVTIPKLEEVLGVMEGHARGGGSIAEGMYRGGG